MKLIDEARERAVIVLEHCAKSMGFYASGLPGGYEATWARDSMITSLGAALAGKKFEEPFRKSLELLAKNQTDFGLIPNAVGCWNDERGSDVTFNSIDAPLWYIIGNHVYKNAYNDHDFFRKFLPNIEKALAWLKSQDPNNDGLIVQQPTSDWEDAFPHKYGRVISTQALYYAALKLSGETERAERLKRIVNGDIEKYLALYDHKLGYYLPWRWKSHNAFQEGETWFDSFGNFMAIVSGLATEQIVNRILSYVERNKINRPYPCKTTFPPLKKGDKEWHDYFEDCEAREPYHYSNAGIWPFIGGFYVAALVKAGELEKAEKELELLAEANRKINENFDDHLPKDRIWGFQEWLHGQTGEAIGGSNPYQGWSAGMYLYAYECVKNKKILHFN